MTYQEAKLFLEISSYLKNDDGQRFLDVLMDRYAKLREYVDCCASDVTSEESEIAKEFLKDLDNQTVLVKPRLIEG